MDATRIPSNKKKKKKKKKRGGGEEMMNAAAREGKQFIPLIRHPSNSTNVIDKELQYTTDFIFCAASFACCFVLDTIN